MTTLEDQEQITHVLEPEPDPEPEPEEEEKATGSSSREYIVLEAAGPGWKEVTRVDAASPSAAIHSLEGDLKKDVRYVAVPKRNWKPAKPNIKIETTITLEFEEE